MFCSSSNRSSASGAGEFGLADARGAEEYEAADGAFGVFQPGAGAADGVGHGGYGFVLSDHALVEPLFQAHELVRFGFQQAVNGYACPFSHQLADVSGEHNRVHFLGGRLGAAGLVLLDYAETFGAQPGGPLVVGAAGRGLFLVQQAVGTRLGLYDVGGPRLGVNAEVGRGFVYEVNRLVGQQAVGDVTQAEVDGSLDGLVGYLDLVMRFVLGSQALEHFDGGIGVRLLDQDGLEAPFERGVLLDVFAVFGLGGRADGLEFSASERGLHHVRGVERTLGGSRPDDGVEFVYEQDYLALCLAYFVHDGLEAFLELASELGSGDQRAHVEGENASSAQFFRGVAGGYALRQPFDDGGLSDAGGANEDGVVLGAAYERLHDAADLDVAPDDGVEQAVLRQFGQVYAVAFEGAVATLGARVGHPVSAANLPERLVHPLGVNAVLPEDGRDLAAVFHGERDEQVFGAYELVVEAVGFGLGAGEDGFGPGRHEYLVGLARQLGGGVQSRAQGGAHRVPGRSHLFQRGRRGAIVLLQERHQDMLGVPLAVSQAAHYLLRFRQRFAGLFGEVVGTQNHPIASVGCRP